MSQLSTERHITSRVVRPGDGGFREEDGAALTMPALTMEERIEAVWTLTQLCYAWNRDEAGEPRLQRSVTRILRP